MDELDILTVQDEEFEKRIRDGLTASYEEEGLCVTENLIAETLKAIEAERIGQSCIFEKAAKCEENGLAKSAENETGSMPVSNMSDTDKATADDNNVTDVGRLRRARRSRFIKIAAGIAAAVFVGVVGISLFGGGLTKKDSAQSEMFMKAPMYSMNFSPEAADAMEEDVVTMSDESIADCSVAEENAIDSSGNTESTAVGENAPNGNVDGAESTAAGENALTCNESIDFANESDYETDNGLDCYYCNLSGDESADLFEELRSAALDACQDVIYEITGFVTGEIAARIPEDLGEALMVISYTSSDIRYMGTVCIYRGYCEIHDDNPVSSISSDYSSRLLTIKDGETLAAELKALLQQAEAAEE